MKKMKRTIALLLAMLVLAALLGGCSSKQCAWCGKSIRGSGNDTGAGYVCDDCYSSLSAGAAPVKTSSNTGVWIAIVVMVFIAVFSATSGVVYLVLQKKLAPPVRRIPRAVEPEYDDIAMERPRLAPRPAAPRTPAGGWICPRDRTRNTGPYCTTCGADRPTAPVQNLPRQRPAQSPSRPAADTYAAEAVQRANRQAAPAQRPAPRVPQEPAPQQRPPVRPAPPEEPVKKPYTPRFAAPQKRVEQEPETESEILAAIFREVAKDPEQ